MKFIRLGAILINPSTIRTITMTDTRYTIQFVSENVSGTCLFGSGMVSSSNRYLVIDKKENASDYRVLEHWITKNEIFK
jgi:hypothetical protein